MKEYSDNTSPVVVALTMGFVNLLKRVNSEGQLEEKEEHIAFNKAYEAAYLDVRKHIVNDYGKNFDNPLRRIRNAKDWSRESEKQALLIIGATMVRQGHSAVGAANIIAHLFYKNEIDESSVLEIAESILEMRNLLDKLLKDE